MRPFTSEHLLHWASGTGLVAVGALGWALLVPGGALWSTGVAAGVVGTALVTAALLRSRANPTLAQVIEIAEHDEIGPRPRGEARL